MSAIPTFLMAKAGLHHNCDKKSRKTFLVGKSSGKYLFTLASKNLGDDLVIVSKQLDGTEWVLRLA